ncbi:MAG TPA: response regulator [Moraxellaceae bacterium]|nr:response regulator [Moraxellaceae bacterium]
MALPVQPGSPLILLIEDEPEIAAILQDYLRHEGMRTLHAGDGQEGLELLRRQSPALVLLDIRLPGQNGIDILQAIRSEGNTPVIMLTALTDDLNKLLSLRLGADDYIAKPFNPAEVVARVHTVLRRSSGGQASTPATVTIGPLTIDYDMHAAMVTDAGKAPHSLPLTLTEFRLLAHMARQPKRCFSRNELIEACMPESEALDRVVDSHLSKLRRKLYDEGCGDLIETVRGVGYRLCPSH